MTGSYKITIVNCQSMHESMQSLDIAEECSNTKQNILQNTVFCTWLVSVIKELREISTNNTLGQDIQLLESDSDLHVILQFHITTRANPDSEHGFTPVNYNIFRSMILLASNLNFIKTIDISPTDLSLMSKEEYMQILEIISHSHISKFTLKMKEWHQDNGELIKILSQSDALKKITLYPGEAKINADLAKSITKNINSESSLDFNLIFKHYTASDKDNMKLISHLAKCQKLHGFYTNYRNLSASFIKDVSQNTALESFGFMVNDSNIKQIIKNDKLDVILSKESSSELSKESSSEYHIREFRIGLDHPIAEKYNSDSNNDNIRLLPIDDLIIKTAQSYYIDKLILTALYDATDAKQEEILIAARTHIKKNILMPHNQNNFNALKVIEECLMQYHGSEICDVNTNSAISLVPLGVIQIIKDYCDNSVSWEFEDNM